MDADAGGMTLQESIERDRAAWANVSSGAGGELFQPVADGGAPVEDVKPRNLAHEWGLVPAATPERAREYVRTPRRRVSPGTSYVRGYTRRNGTYVRGHVRRRR